MEASDYYTLVKSMAEQMEKDINNCGYVKEGDKK